MRYRGRPKTSTNWSTKGTSWPRTTRHSSTRRSRDRNISVAMHVLKMPPCCGVTRTRTSRMRSRRCGVCATSTPSPTYTWSTDMTLRDRRTRRTGARTNGERQVTRTPLGGVRRAQIITTFGVGSMIAIGARSFVMSGIDTWRVRESDVDYEPRLQHWLGVNSFQLPPADVPSSGDGGKIRLFPEIYSCPECRGLKEFGRFGSPPGKR